MVNFETDIVIIDDGVNTEFYEMGTMEFDIEIDNGLSIKTRTAAYPYSPSHGTTCAAIIRKYAPNAKIGSIKILDEKSRRGLKYQLIKAIQWCIRNKIRLVNLSLGTIDFRDFDEIRNCINRAAKKGLIIVAACSNKNVYTIPACLTNVIGVNCKNIYTDQQFNFNIYPYNGIDISASGRHYLTDVNGNSRYTYPSNSFAAPLITAKVHDLIKEDSAISLEGIKQKLFVMADNKKKEEYNPYFNMNVDWNNNYRDFIEDLNLSKHIKRKFWCEKLYTKRLDSLIERTVEIEIPIIVVYSSSTFGDKVHELYTQFFNDGYFCVLVSTDSKDILKGYEYLPESISPNKMISLVYSKYNCDVILIKTGNKKELEEIDKKVDVDLKIYIMDIGNYIIYYISNKKEAISIKTDVYVNKIRNVYNKILECFE